MADLARLAELGHAHGAIVVVDNTFASPYLCQPLELGVDLVVESATKWLSGHSDVIAGVVAGRRGAHRGIRAREHRQRRHRRPFSAFLVLRGLQTLHVRMDRHSRVGGRPGATPGGEPAVRQVAWPGLPSHPQAAVAQRQLRAGGGMLAIDLGARATAAAAFIDGLAIPPVTATLGSVVTYAVHPPTATHRQLDEAQLLRGGHPARPGAHLGRPRGRGRPAGRRGRRRWGRPSRARVGA